MSYSPKIKFKSFDISIVIYVIILCAFLFLSVILLIENTPQTIESMDNEFILISENETFKFYKVYDKDTKVIYIINYEGVVSPLLNSQGNPVLYIGGN